MAHSRISGKQMAATAATVFRTLGYQGTSLEELAEAMGLQKASLYYRYPEGKSGIALAAIASVGRWFEEQVFAPLEQPGLPAPERLALVAASLREFYADGTRPCVLDTLSLPGGSPELAAALQGTLSRWQRAFTLVARASGLPTREAARRAEDAVIAIEGSLVLSRVRGDGSSFLRVIAGLPALLLHSS